MRESITKPREIFPNLYLVHSRTDKAGYCYLLRRKKGNVLVPNFNKEMIEQRLDAIESLGGVEAICVCERHNAKSKNFPNKLTDQYRPPIFISDIDAKTYRVKLPNVKPLKFERQWIFDDLEAIPAPGYSTGAFVYLWHNARKKYLFIGPTITWIDGAWKTWVASSISDKKFREILRELKEIVFDVLVLNSFSNDKAWFEMTSAQRNKMFDGLIENPNHGKG